jgi:hypothetical protein
MNRRLSIVLGGVALVAALFSILLPSRGSDVQPSTPIAFRGTFDPYEVYVKTVKGKRVFKARPDCRTCHARASISRTTGKEPRLRLHLVVEHGKKTASWTLLGTTTPKGVVFAKKKLTVTYANNALSGTFNGRMRARISLQPDAAARPKQPKSEK